MRPLILALLGSFGLACSFDASGISATSGSTGAGSSSGDPHASSSSTGEPAPTSAAPTTPRHTSEPDPTTESVDPGTTSTGPALTTESTDPGTSTSSSTGEPDTTTSTGADESSSSETTAPPDTTMMVDPCEGVTSKEIALVADAEVVAPMEKVMSQMGEGMIARSTVENAGTVTFTVDIECEGKYSLWGRALDLNAGAKQNDPDSYFVQVDGGQEVTWIYGCQTDGMPNGYNWLRVRGVGNNCSNPNDVAPTLTAGSHTFRFRNRESGNQNAVAALARILLTNDPGYTPTAPGD